MSEQPTRFICYKWGHKYPALYVNRLYSMIKNNYKRPFVMHCITDDGIGIDNNVVIEDLDKLSSFRGSSTTMFTIEKVSAFRYGFLNCAGPYVLLDLDILIQNDLTDYLNESYNFSEFRMINNYWAPHDAVIKAYGHSYCSINSSFVTWKEDQAHHLYNYYKKNIDKISRVYWSLDHALYYLNENQYGFHPSGIVYSYNAGAEWPDDVEVGLYRKDYKICIFNNSHGHGFDLPDTKGWAKDMWVQYDNT